MMFHFCASDFFFFLQAFLFRCLSDGIVKRSQWCVIQVLLVFLELVVIA